MKIQDRFGRWRNMPKNRKFKKRLSAYGLLIKKGKILLIKPTAVNRWELPGGGVEKNETLEKGLKREFLEESGFNIKKFKKLALTTTKNFYADDTDEYFKAVMKFFYIKSVGKQNKRKILRHEIRKIKWINLKSLDKINIFLPYYKIIKKYLPPHLYMSQCKHIDNRNIGVGVYQHYKAGKKYKVLGIAKHSESLEELVIYQTQYGKKMFWARPKKIFLEKIIVGGKKIPRFKYLGK